MAAPMDRVLPDHVRIGQARLSFFMRLASGRDGGSFDAMPYQLRGEWQKKTTHWHAATGANRSSDYRRLQANSSQGASAVKTTLAIMFAALAFSAPAVNHAHAEDAPALAKEVPFFWDNLQTFNEFFDGALALANDQKEVAKQYCSEKYCQDIVSFHSGTTPFVLNTMTEKATGRIIRELCFTIYNGNKRICGNSTGRSWSEIWDGAKYNRDQELTTTWGNTTTVKPAS
jgi:hypothetical protein